MIPAHRKVMYWSSIREIGSLRCWRIPVLSSIGGLSSNTNGDKFNENSPYGSLVTGDYDKDGFDGCVALAGNGPAGVIRCYCVM